MKKKAPKPSITMSYETNFSDLEVSIKIATKHLTKMNMKMTKDIMSKYLECLRYKMENLKENRMRS